MERKLESETILKCQKCGEFLQSKIVTESVDMAGRRVKRHHQELFCPACGNSGRVIKHFENQKHAEKKITKN